MIRFTGPPLPFLVQRQVLTTMTLPTRPPTPATQCAATEFGYDVVVVGYGPVGRLLALQLGKRGHRVAVIERQEKAYPLPRAVHFDDEVGRILQASGAGPNVMNHAVEPYDDFYEWRNAERETLLRLDWRGPGLSGWNVSHFFYQPGVEAALDAQVRELDTVTVWRGWEVISCSQSTDSVAIEARNADDARMRVTGRYVIGADGANSRIRGLLGSPMTDLGYFHDWLVVDLIPTGPMPVEPPAWQLCDPARPTTIVPGGPGRRRFEFMRLEHETSEDLNTEARVWELLAPWGVTPDTATMERHTVYTFQARWCDQWRHERLLIAGDAAHLMPPFAGQGMCSGLRDVANLEWKLDLVLTGSAPDSILDTYGSERAEHVRHFIDESMQLGAVICMTDADQATQRDSAMIADLAAGRTMPPRPLPRLGAGLHRDDAGGGTLAIQALVRDAAGSEGLFDDVFGPSGTLLLSNPDLHRQIESQVRDHLSQIGFQVVAFGNETADGTAIDLTGAYRRWFDELNATAVLVRPDFYIYGIATSTYSPNQLVEDFLTALDIDQAVSVSMVNTP